MHSVEHPRWRGFLCLLIAVALGTLSAGCDSNTEQSDESETRTSRLAVPRHDAVPGLDIWISVAQPKSSGPEVDLGSLKMAPLGNIAYLPLRNCLSENKHEWPASHAVTSEFELHAGTVQSGTADYVKVGEKEPKQWPLPDDKLEDDPKFVRCIADKITGPIPDKLNLDKQAHLRVRVGLRPTGE